MSFTTLSLFALIAGATAQRGSTCPILFLSNAGTVSGYYTDSNVRWNGRPIYSDRFGNLIYSVNGNDGKNYWHLGHTKVMDSCSSSYVSFRIQSDVSLPAALIGEAFARYCGTRYNYHLKFECVVSDPTVNCDGPPIAGCEDKHDVALVVDFSGSVDGIEMNQQWCLMERLAMELAPGVAGRRVGLAAFAQTATTYVPLTTNGRGITALAGGYFQVSNPPTSPGTGMNRYVIGRMTGIGEGLQEAKYMLTAGESTRVPGATLSVVMMTDGRKNAGTACLPQVIALRAMEAVTLIAGVSVPGRSMTSFMDEYKQYTGDEDLVSFVDDFTGYVVPETFRKLITQTCAAHVNHCSDIELECRVWGTPHYRTVLGETFDVTSIGHHVLFESAIDTAAGVQTVSITTASRGINVEGYATARPIIRYVHVNIPGSGTVVVDTVVAPKSIAVNSQSVSATTSSTFTPLKSGSTPIGQIESKKVVTGGNDMVTHIVTIGNFKATITERFFVTAAAQIDTTVTYVPRCTMSVGAAHPRTAAEWFSNIEGARGLCFSRSQTAVPGLTLAAPAGSPLPPTVPAVVPVAAQFDCDDVTGLDAFTLAACKRDVTAFRWPEGSTPCTRTLRPPQGGGASDPPCTHCPSGSYCNGGVCSPSCGDHARLGSDSQCHCDRGDSVGYWTRRDENKTSCNWCHRDATVVNPSFGGYIGYHGAHCTEPCRGCLSAPDSYWTGAQRSDRATAWGTDASMAFLAEQFNERNSSRDYVSHERPIVLSASAGCSGPVELSITLLGANSFTHNLFGMYNWTDKQVNPTPDPKGLHGKRPWGADLRPFFWDVNQNPQCMPARKARVIKVKLYPGTEYGLFSVTNGWCSEDQGRVGDANDTVLAPFPLGYTKVATKHRGDPVVCSDPVVGQDGLQHFAFLDGDALLQRSTSGMNLGSLIVGVEELFGLGDSDYNDNVFVIEAANGGTDSSSTCGLVMKEAGVPRRPPVELRETFVVNPPEKCVVPIAPSTPYGDPHLIVPYAYWGIIGTIFEDGTCFAGNNITLAIDGGSGGATARSANVASATEDKSQFVDASSFGSATAVKNERRNAQRVGAAEAAGRVAAEVKIVEAEALWFDEKTPNVYQTSDTDFDSVILNDAALASQDGDADPPAASGEAKISADLWIVLFYASWCKPAQYLVPQLEAVAMGVANGTRVAAAEQTRSPRIFRRYDITRTPTVKAFARNGDVFTFTGPVDGGRILAWARVLAGTDPNKLSLNVTGGDPSSPPGTNEAKKDGGFSAMWVIVPWLALGIVVTVLAAVSYKLYERSVARRHPGKGLWNRSLDGVGMSEDVEIGGLMPSMGQSTDLRE